MRVYRVGPVIRQVLWHMSAIVACGAFAVSAWGQSWSYVSGSSGPIYYNGGGVGIGTNSPVAPLDVVGTIRSINNMPLPTSGTGLEFGFNTTSALGRILAYDRTAAVYKAIGIGSNSGKQLYLSGGTAGTVGINTTAPCTTYAPTGCMLSVAGAIQAYEVVVNTGWSDYVFQSDYHLAPLSEVAAYVKDNHHLPGIPSADEVKEKGVSLGDMQAKLLAKVEELTLHMIEMEKENKELRDRVERISNEKSK